MDTGGALIVTAAIGLTSAVVVAMIQRGSRTTMDLLGRVSDELRLLRTELKTDIVEIRGEVSLLRQTVIGHISSKHD